MGVKIIPAIVVGASVLVRMAVEDTKVTELTATELPLARADTAVEELRVSVTTTVDCGGGGAGEEELATATGGAWALVVGATHGCVVVTGVGVAVDVGGA